MTEWVIPYFALFNTSVVIGVIFNMLYNSLKLSNKVTQLLSETGKCLGERVIEMIHGSITPIQLARWKPPLFSIIDMIFLKAGH